MGELNLDELERAVNAEKMGGYRATPVSLEVMERLLSRVRDLEQNAAQVLPLQRALATWLPSIAGQDSDLGRLAADHAMLLYGLAEDCTDCPGDRLHEDAMRYRWLRERDIDAIRNGGVFAGKTPDNVVLNGNDLDAAIDAARKEKGHG